MKPHKIVAARLPVTTSDLGENPPIPPDRLSASALEARVLEDLTQFADIHKLLSEACNQIVNADNAKHAAEIALESLSERFNQEWKGAPGSTVEIQQGQPVYRRLPDGTHVTSGFLMEVKASGEKAPIWIDVAEGVDTYRCYVHVSLNAVAVDISDN
ncbi:MAG TPA: hypothetical protein VK176_05300 [Phycisphaerales bacterium]|nr:hypothetical protein [Phycisphaerales bacterium]